MKKVIKRSILVVVIAAAVIAAAWGIMKLIRNSQKSEVKVYPVSSLMTDYWGDSSESYGFVTTDKLQKIFLTDTQTVKEVYVSEGDSVSKGDKLLAYDTTLTDIELQKDRIAIDKKQLDKETDEAELKSLQNATSLEYLESQYSSLSARLDAAMEELYSEQGDPAELPFGEGTEEAPLYVDRAQYTPLRPADLMSETDDLWLVLVDSGFSGYTGLHFTASSDEENGLTDWSVELFDAAELESPEIEMTDEINSLQKQLDRVADLMATSYSRAEIAQMTSDLTKEIADLDLEIKIAEVDLAKREKEVSDGVVTCDFDGVVTAVNDPQEAYVNNEPVVAVSGGGGYYVTCYVSELAMDTIQIGQTVTVNSWMNGMTYEGTITELGTDPKENADAWTDGNQNVSWYPFTVFISEDADLQENYYVSVTYEAMSGDSGSWYLENPFIRTEDGKSYVMVQNDEGLLEKRYIQTGRDLWGSYTAIKGGLSQEEYIAFPYGQDTVEGAKTVQADTSELWE